jgi:hypothetical protein
MARAENIRVIYSDLSEEWHWKAGRHRKSHIRFGEGVLEKYRRKRQLAGTLLYFTYGSVRAQGCNSPALLDSGRPQPPRRSRVGSGRRGAEAGPEGRRSRTAA